MSDKTALRTIRPRRIVRVLAAAGLAVLASSCIVRSRVVEAVDVPVIERPIPVTIESPVRAHLIDGGVAVYSSGVTLVNDTLVGVGFRHDFLRRDSITIARLPMDSVLAMESYREAEDKTATTALSVPATAVGGTLATGAGALLAVAIFGSCPTIYSDSAGTEVLESEAFPYSIAPLFEMRDVDRLGARADAAGMIELDVRNEALETHYINQLAVIEVGHAPDEWAVADQRGQPLVVGSLRAPARIASAAGVELSDVFALGDGVAYVASDSAFDRIHTPEQVTDGIELALDAPAGDSVALVLRLRNSLLNTILFYEFMLASQGAGALDWLGSELNTIGPAVDIGHWYSAHMGIRVSVRNGDEWHEVGRIPDVGPIAWKDIALVVPVLERDSLRVRLTFLTDSWRIDRITLGERLRRPAGRQIAADEVVSAGDADESARGALAAADESWLRTMPGERFVARFQAGAALPPEGARTFLLVSQGYYIEWVRSDWIRAAATSARPFTPSDQVLVDLMRRWADARHDFEARFHDARVPVR